MIGEAIVGGFISKIINDCVDISKAAIKKADKERKSRNQSLQSRIYQVIIDTLNKISNNQYKGKDVIYDAAESILKGFKSGECDRISVVKSGLQVFLSFVDNDICEEFMDILRHEIAADENFDIYKEILLVLLEQQANYDHSELQEIKEILKEVTKKLSEKDIDYQNESIKRTVKSRTQEYADKWNENMFLNDFDKRDENAGINVKLSEVYLEEHLPHYIWGKNEKPSCDLKTLLSEYINVKSDKKMLLILGQPGIGKSTLITWITANFIDRNNDILVFQFASDLKNIDGYYLNNDKKQLILGELKLSLNDLEGKVLILDGFDEISTGNSRAKILNSLYRDFKQCDLLHNFSLIITCRENYIQNMYDIECDYITLQSWQTNQIQSFCEVYSKKAKCSITKKTIMNILKNKEILGIPLILYMVLGLGISIEKEGSIVEVYDQIFSFKDGGIYERCFKNIKKNKKERYDNPHWISVIKKQIHQISRGIAIWMFENNPNEAYIPQEEYEKICDDVMKEGEQENESIKADFKIGNYFKLVKHCEGVETEELYFVHRSIYEYFVVETIYSSIENAMIKLTQESQLDLAGKIAFYLKEGEISPAIGEYLQHKIIKLYNGLIIEKKQFFFKWWESTVEKMMEVGMFYYTKENIQIYTNIIAKEVRCFINLVEVLRLLIDISEKKYIFTSINNKVIEKYIRYCSMEFESLNLSRVSLTNVNLARINLCRVNLNNSYLYKVNFNGAYLYKAELNGAYLEEIDLSEADLSGSRLEGAHLKEVDLRRTYFYEAVLQRDDIQDILPQIKNSIFASIIIKDKNEIHEVGKSELFPEESILLTEERNFNKDEAYNKWFI